ncbi:MAG: hypothetical protein L3V56_00145 [Candidatus Magnetoovum sp. WYHC-5]|nr:hypothetical protein [Candidatus Magnetoovum sp. WYHC-5]
MDDKNKENSDELFEFVKFMERSINATLEAFYDIQDISENVLMDMSNRNMDIQREAQQVIRDFFDAAKKGREELKKVMDKGFNQLERSLKNK